jgi:hypothetical protein
MGKNETSGSDGVEHRELVIQAPNLKVALFTIRGVAPLVLNAFSEKARNIMKAKQEAGSTAKKGKAREPKDFQACYEGAKHVSDDGWLGFSASAIRAGMISACRVVGFKMTLAKLSVFVHADGFDKVDGTPLIRIRKGTPQYVEHACRNETGVCDIRARPMWKPGWEAVVRVEYDADQFTLDDIGNLLLRVGKQVGIGEGRPDSPKSCGMGWGLFDIVGKEAA